MKNFAVNLPPRHITITTTVSTNVDILHPFTNSQSFKIYGIKSRQPCTNVVPINKPIQLKAAGCSPMSWTGTQLRHLGKRQPESFPVGTGLIDRFVCIEGHRFEEIGFRCSPRHDKCPTRSGLGCQVTIDREWRSFVVKEFVNSRISSSSVKVIKAVPWFLRINTKKEKKWMSQ